MKKCLVTGAGGFIGSHLVETLVSSGHSVRAYVRYNSRNDWGCLEEIPADVRSQVEIVTGDVADPFSVQKAVEGCDTVFHLAALIGIPYSYDAPESYVSTNIRGTLNVLQAAMRAGCSRVIQTSTSETYGTARYVPIDEAHPLQGQSPYSASKIGADKIAESFYLSFGVPVVTVRPFNTFGPRQSARAIIPTVISQLVSGATTLRIGSLDPIRDLTFVGDTAAGFLAAAGPDAAVGETINLGNGKGISIGDLIAKIQRIIGTDVPIVTDEARIRPANSEVMRLVADATKAEKILGWRPKVSLDDGLAASVEYVKAKLGRYKPDLYNV